jgi:hypothetical protein
MEWGVSTFNKVICIFREFSEGARQPFCPLPSAQDCHGRLRTLVCDKEKSTSQCGRNGGTNAVFQSNWNAMLLVLKEYVNQRGHGKFSFS